MNIFERRSVLSLVFLSCIILSSCQLKSITTPSPTPTIEIFQKVGKWESETNSQLPVYEEPNAEKVSFTVGNDGNISDFTIIVTWSVPLSSDIQRCTITSPEIIVNSSFSIQYTILRDYQLLYNLNGMGLLEEEKDQLRKSSYFVTPIKSNDSEQFMPFELLGNFDSPTTIKGTFSIMMCGDELIQIFSYFGEWKAEWKSE